MGSFKIIQKVGTSSYKLHLPASMTIHNTFHISVLEPYEDNSFPSQIQTPPPPIEIDGEPAYELEEIIDSRVHRSNLQYRAKWTGYSPEHNKTWYPAENFENASIAIKQFHSRYPRKPRVGTRDHHPANLRTFRPPKGRKRQYRRQLPSKTDGTTTGSFRATLPALACHTLGQWRRRNSEKRRKRRYTRGCLGHQAMTTSALWT